MKVTICSRESINERIANNSLQNVAVISFSDPKGGRRGEDYAPVDFGETCPRVFFVCVYDLDPDALPHFGYTMESYFSEVDEVAEFIGQAVEDGVELICQCEYGQSRSAGLASAILEYYERRGIEIFRDYRYYPNQLIFNKAYEALERYYHREEK